MTRIQRMFQYLKSNTLEVLGSLIMFAIIIAAIICVGFSLQWVWLQTFGATRVASVPAAAVMQADAEAKNASADTIAALKSATEKMERVEAPTPAPTAASAPTVTAAVKPVVVRPQSAPTQHAKSVDCLATFVAGSGTATHVTVNSQSRGQVPQLIANHNQYRAAIGCPAI